MNMKKRNIAYMLMCVAVAIVLSGCVQLTSQDTTPVLYERNNGIDDTWYYCYYGNGGTIGQTFTVGATGTNEDFMATSVKINIYLAEGIATDVHMQIRPTYNDVPCALISGRGTLQAENVTSGWNEIVLDTPALLEAGTSYGIVVNRSYSPNQLNVRIRGTHGDDYAGGEAYTGNSFSGPWYPVHTPNDDDFLFEVWGYSA